MKHLLHTRLVLFAIFLGLTVALRAQAAQLTLSFDYKQGTLLANGFEVERATGSVGTFSKVFVVPSTSTVVGTTITYSWLDNTLTAGTSYSYRVRAYNDGGPTSTYSNTATGVAFTPVLPPNGTFGPTPTVSTPPPKYIAMQSNETRVFYSGSLVGYNSSSWKLNISPDLMTKVLPGQPVLLTIN